MLGAGRLGLRDHLGLSLRRRGRNRDRRQPGRPGLEYTNHTLAVAFDAEGAFLVRGAEQVHQRGKAVGTFVKRRRLRSYDLFDLPQVERPLANLGGGNEPEEFADALNGAADDGGRRCG